MFVDRTSLRSLIQKAHKKGPLFLLKKLLPLVFSNEELAKLVVKDWCKKRKKLMKTPSLHWIHRKLPFAKVSIMTSDFLTNISENRF